MKLIFTQMALLSMLSAVGQSTKSLSGRDQASIEVADVGISRMSSDLAEAGGRPSYDQGIVRFDFGDGSVSHIYPPRPIGDQRASLGRTVLGHAMLDQEVIRTAPLAIARLISQGHEGATEEVPVLVKDRGHLVLVFREDFMRELSVRAADWSGKWDQEEEGRTKLGRWELPADMIDMEVRFLAVQDRSAGTRWVIPISSAIE